MRILLIISTVLLLPACSLIDVRDNVTYEHDNKRVPEELIDQIKAGKTTTKWTREYLGKPDGTKSHKNGSEIWTYHFSENVNKRVRIAWLLRYEDKGQKDKNIYIHFVDGVVHKLWRDYTLPLIPEDRFNYHIIDQVEPPKEPKAGTPMEVETATVPSTRSTPPKNQQDEWWWPL